METYNLKKSTKIGLIVSAVLCLAVLVNDAFAIVTAFQLGITPTAALAFIDVVMCSIILLYAFFGYKKPHGNLLKYRFLAFAGYIALQGTIELTARSAFILGDLLVLSGLIMAFLAGRLNKIKKNIIVLTGIGLLFLVRILIVFLEVPVVFGFTDVFSRLTIFIIFAALSFAYIARYEEHKAAGLEDKQ